MQRLLMIMTILLIISCEKEESILHENGSNFPCSTEEIRLVKDKDCCEIEESRWLCDILEVEEITYLNPSSFNLLPNLCDEVGSNVVFSNGGNKTQFNIIDKGHYILHHAPYAICRGTHENQVFIIQKNEIAYLDLRNNLFGKDTIHLELKSIVNTYDGSTPGLKEDYFILSHPDSESNRVHFHKVYKVGNNQMVDNWSNTFHSELRLNGDTYLSVMEFKVADNIRVEPHTRLYVNEELGWFAFEKQNTLWIKE